MIAATFPHLCRLCRRAARGKRQSPAVAAFLLDQDAHLRRLQQDLSARTYQPGPGHSFWIQDPKPRRIYALPFRDRVAQHLLIDLTLPSIERALSPHTHACRDGHGTHRALRQAAALHRTRRWVLRVDVRKFFPSIDHALLRRQLLRHTPPDWRWLMDRFLIPQSVGERVDFHFPGDDLLTPLLRPHGLPIGSLTSQIWANLYLSPLDHALSSYLGLPDFVRYCDDLLIYSDDREPLRAALPRILAITEGLRLRLHPIKTRLHRTTDPVPFLGFVLRRHPGGVRIRLREDNVLRMRRRMRQASDLFYAGAIDLDEVTCRIRAWLAHARHAHSQRLIEAELARLRFVRGDDDGDDGDR